jgi:hypothetical protein
LIAPSSQPIFLTSGYGLETKAVRDRMHENVATSIELRVYHEFPRVLGYEYRMPSTPTTLNVPDQYAIAASYRESRPADFPTRR